MAETDFRSFAEQCADVICKVSLDMTLEYVSPAALEVLGWRPEELLGTGPELMVLAEDLPVLRAAARQTRVAGMPDLGTTVRMRRKDGRVIWVEIRAKSVLAEVTGMVREVVLVMRDVSARKLLEERLSALALTDGLTGLANRRAFDEALEREWKRTLREGTQMSLLLLDIDHFKRFNDEHGHQVGDDCLRAVAAAAAGAVRRTDTVARYGGEEIAIILPAVDVAGAAETAEKVRAAIEGLGLAHAGNPEGGGWVTASIGAATALARHGGSMTMPENLLQVVDNALYKAKRGGRNRVGIGMLIATQDLQYA